MIIPICGVFAAAAAVIYAGSTKWLKIVDLRIESDKIKPGGDIRILHISDLHGNSLTKPNLDIRKKLGALTQKSAGRLPYDFAVITGDLVLDYLDELNPHLEMLAELARKTPVYYVDGNHEKYIYSDMVKKLGELGIKVLCNEKTLIEINGSMLNIIGMRDWYWLRKNKFDAAGVFASGSGADKDRFTLLLSHQPQIFDIAKNFGTDLILCGHTHGGQVRLPGLPALYAPGQGFFPKYSHGIYKAKNCRMFISKGIGATNFRVRFYNRPEIAVVTLTAPKNAG